MLREFENVIFNKTSEAFESHGSSTISLDEYFADRADKLKDDRVEQEFREEFEKMYFASQKNPPMTKKTADHS
jgi:uridine kinase